MLQQQPIKPALSFLVGHENGGGEVQGEDPRFPRGSAVPDVRVPWRRDVQRITELTANDNIIAVTRQS
jgi:hypothetical protein